MSNISALLPATALVAIAIFIAKEVTEFIRRWRADARRKVALHTLLARECELNHWTLRSLRRIATELAGLSNPESVSSFRIDFEKSGRIYACMDPSDSGQYLKIAVPSAHRDVLDKHLLEVATLDNDLYLLADSALTAIAELEHLREGVIFHGSAEDTCARKVTDGFGEYAMRELDEAHEKIAALYKACAGTELADVRLR